MAKSGREIASEMRRRMGWVVHTGSALEILRGLKSSSVNCVVTSPPYWGLRDYGAPGQIGLEGSFAEFLANLVNVFGEVRRVLRDDGTLWVNMGDCYATGWVGQQGQHGERASRNSDRWNGTRTARKNHGLKNKDLMGQPWRLAFALQDMGFWLRSDVIWQKPNPMPLSVKDRPTTAHE